MIRHLRKIVKTCEFVRTVFLPREVADSFPLARKVWPSAAAPPPPWCSCFSLFQCECFFSAGFLVFTESFLSVTLTSAVLVRS